MVGVVSGAINVVEGAVIPTTAGVFESVFIARISLTLEPSDTMRPFPPELVVQSFMLATTNMVNGVVTGVASRDSVKL